MTEVASVDRNRLEAVLEATGRAHHAAYLETDGHDPEWPLWYARHAQADMRTILGRPKLTESRLVWAFVSCDDALSAEERPEPWHRFYADFLIRKLVPRS